ncbi:MAG: hypothetical protein FH756_18520 [Firmicutes bacterium]|nr:hypothetical protein [Bacillota bacterium]
MESLLFFLQGIPESAGIVAVSLAVARVPLRWGRILLIGALLALLIFMIRALPFTFGLHTMVMLLLTVLFITKTTYTSLTKSFVAVFASALLLATLEILLHEFFFSLIGLETQKIVSDYLIWKLIGLPQAFLMLIVSILISWFYKPFESAWKK